MPLYESACASNVCVEFARPVEWRASTWETPDPSCVECGGPTKRMISQFGIVFTGPLTAKYNDPKADNAHQEGHYAWRTKNTKDGKPEMVWIDSFDAQREHCRSEGLVNPKDLGPGEVGGDGKTLSTRGMPGCW